MHRALGAENRKLATFGSVAAHGSVTGRLAAKDIADPMGDRGFLVVDAIDRCAYHITARPQVDLGGLPVGAVVAVSKGPKPRAADPLVLPREIPPMYPASVKLGLVGDSRCWTTVRSSAWFRSGQSSRKASVRSSRRSREVTACHGISRSDVVWFVSVGQSRKPTLRQRAKFPDSSPSLRSP